MSNNEQVNEKAMELLSEAFYSMGYRKGIIDISRAFLLGIGIVVGPFVCMAIQDRFNKKKHKKTED